MKKLIFIAMVTLVMLLSISVTRVNAAVSLITVDDWKSGDAGRKCKNHTNR